MPPPLAWWSPGSFYNDEESKVNEARLIQFFRDIENDLSNYPSERLILMGVEEYLAMYKKSYERLQKK